MFPMTQIRETERDGLVIKIIEIYGFGAFLKKKNLLYEVR
jgi:hypothetical protein